METTRKIWTKEEVRENLLKNDIWVNRAILALYERQTSSEKASGTTNVHNGKGFSGFDARWGCYCGTWIKAGKPLTGKYLDKARKLTTSKYLKQITDIANGLR